MPDVPPIDSLPAIPEESAGPAHDAKRSSFLLQSLCLIVRGEPSTCLETGEPDPKKCNSPEESSTSSALPATRLLQLSSESLLVEWKKEPWFCSRLPSTRLPSCCFLKEPERVDAADVKDEQSGVAHADVSECVLESTGDSVLTHKLPSVFGMDIWHSPLRGPPRGPPPFSSTLSPANSIVKTILSNIPRISLALQTATCRCLFLALW